MEERRSLRRLLSSSTGWNPNIPQPKKSWPEICFRGYGHNHNRHPRQAERRPGIQQSTFTFDIAASRRMDPRLHLAGGPRMTTSFGGALLAPPQKISHIPGLPEITCRFVKPVKGPTLVLRDALAFHVTKPQQVGRPQVSLFGCFSKKYRSFT